MNKKQIKYIVLLILVMGLSACGVGNDSNDNIKDKVPVNEKQEKKPIVKEAKEIKENYTLDEYLVNVGNSEDEKRKNASKELVSGNYKEAVEKWEEIVSNPGREIESTGDKLMLISAYLNYGTAYYKEEEYSLKAKKLLDSLGLDENNGYYRFNLGYSFEITRDYKRAISEYKNALKFFEGKEYALSMVYNQIGHVYDLMGNTDLAYENYLKAYGYNGENLYVLTNLARNLVKQNNLNDATIYYEEALKKTNNKTLKSEILYSLSSITIFSGGKENISTNIEKAFNYANESIKTNPENTNGYMIRGKVLYYAGKDNYDEAILSLNDAIVLYKHNYSAYETLGLIALDKGENQKALDLLNKAYITIDKDISLMGDVKIGNKARVKLYSSMANSMLGNKKEAMNNINDLILSGDLLTMILFKEIINKELSGKYNNLKSEDSFQKLVSNIKKLKI